MDSMIAQVSSKHCQHEIRKNVYKAWGCEGNSLVPDVPAVVIQYADGDAL